MGKFLLRGALCLASLLALAGCGGEPPAKPTPFKPIADTRTLMQAVIDPSADHIWNSVGMDITAAGRTEIRPQNDQEWQALRNQAVTLAESGNLLMMAPRARDEEWTRLSQALIDTASDAIVAIDAKNPDQVFDAGGAIYAVCTNCHAKYDPLILKSLRE
jgi:hypothetical protein